MKAPGGPGGEKTGDSGPTAPLRSTGDEQASGTLVVRLRVAAGPDRGKVFTLSAASALVGTHADCEVALTDPSVSRFHLKVERLQQGVRVSDRGSKNGTWLRGARLEWFWARDGTRFQVGGTELLIQLDKPEHAGPGDPFEEVVAHSAPMQQVLQTLRRVARTDATVLICGETGTGKGLLAKGVHRASRRAGGPWVVVDCAGLTASLVESELFGHARGAFTGAVSAREGLLATAHGGTVFLDEIGELPLELQPKLLRFLEAGTVQRLGESEGREVDVRVVAATHRDLNAEVEAGRFRQDLLYRLGVVAVEVPPLRDRPEDLEPLFRGMAARLGSPDIPLPDEVRSYVWPGNVRELRNFVERAIAADVAGLGPGAFEPGKEGTEEVSGPHLPEPRALVDLPFPEAKERMLSAFVKEYLLDVLRRADGNVTDAAALAGLSRAHVHGLMRRHGVGGAPARTAAGGEGEGEEDEKKE